MNTPLSILYQEHEEILRVLDSIPAKLPDGEAEIAKFRAQTNYLLRFFRLYADAYHHQKEEQVLFPEMIRKNSLLGDGILREMLNNHEEFREMLREIETLIGSDKLQEAYSLILRYAELLKDHIAAENDEVFPSAEGLFTSTELRAIEDRFLDGDRDLGIARKGELLKTVIGS